MKKYMTLLLTLTLSTSLFPQQKQAREVLDRTAAEFSKAGGVEAVFDIKVLEDAKTIGKAQGKMFLNGDKFMLDSDEVLTWFDGETQWTFRNEEVNISNPTEDELVSINPYLMLSMYKKGFNVKSFKDSDKTKYEIALVSTDKKSDVSNVILFIDKKTYQPVQINAQLRDGKWNEIIITKYRIGLNHPNSLFVFDESKYPDAEIIDLR